MSGHQPKQLVRLTQAQLDEAVQRHALYRDSRSGGRRAVLVGYDMSGLKLTGGDMSHADCTGSSFYGADLSGARFDCATLFACDFRQANLENVSMVHADVRGCFFAGAAMAGANLFEADLRPGSQITLDESGDFHVVRPPDKAGAVAIVGFNGANLTNASLAGVVAVQTDFSEAVMRGCKLVRAHIRGANFSGTNLEGADFAQADTRDACFRGAVIAGANFDYANLAGADLQDVLSDKPSGRLLSELNASIEQLLRRHRQFIESSGAAGSPLDLSGFDLRGAGAFTAACLTMLKASGAVFYGLDLSHCELQAALCAKADFRGCRLDGADMRGINLSSATLNGASLRSVRLSPLLISGERRMQADLSGANLRHADLRDADMRGTRLAGADMSFADLTGANLAQAELGGARLSGCKVSHEQLESVLAA